MRAQQGEIRTVVGPGQCPYNCSTCSCMCKAVFEEQHRHTISFALERINLKENASEDAAPEKAIAVLSRYIGDALENHHVREMQHRDGRNEEEVFQDAASKTAYEIYSNPRFAAADGNFRMSLKDDILCTTDVRLRRGDDSIGGNRCDGRAHGGDRLGGDRLDGDDGRGSDGRGGNGRGNRRDGRAHGGDRLGGDESGGDGRGSDGRGDRGDGRIHGFDGGLGGNQLGGGDGRGGRGGGSVTSIAQARRQARGNNVPSNENFVSNSSNRHYRNRLENEPVNVNVVSARAASAAGISSPSAGGAAGAGISSPSVTRMVDRTRLKATRKMIDPSSTPRTKKRACIVRVALAERNQSFVSIIEDTLPACSQEALDVCMLQASLQE